jgi:hypothetical protein
MLRLMRQPPHAAAEELSATAPIRASGIMPAPAMDMAVSVAQVK